MAIEPIPPSTSATEPEALPPATSSHVYLTGNASIRSMAPRSVTHTSDTPHPLRTEVDAAILSNWNQPQRQQPQRSPFFIHEPPAAPPFSSPTNNGIDVDIPGASATAKMGAVDVTTDTVTLSARGQAAGFGVAKGVGASIAEGVGDTKQVRTTTVLAAEGGQYRLQGNAETLTISRTPTAVIGKAVRSNKVSIQLSAISFRASLDAALEQMRISRSNEDPARYEEMRKRVDDFLVASQSDDEGSAVAATLSLSEGLRNWWTTDHSSICNKALNMSLFAGGLALCALAGALGPVGVVTVGTLIGGKDVASALESCVKILARRD